MAARMAKAVAAVVIAAAWFAAMGAIAWLVLWEWIKALTWGRQP